MMYLEPFEKEEIEKGINISHTPSDGNNVNNVIKKKKSRHENGWNFLHDQHPMRFTHKEKLKSKQVLPVISSRTPRLAHEVPDEDCTMKRDAALFYLTLFCPVDPKTGLLIAVWASHSDGIYDSSLSLMKPYNEEVNENAKESMVQTLLDDYRLVVEPSWETFIHMLRWLSRPNRTFSEKHILQCILNMNSSLHVNHHRKLVFTKMNFNNTKPWDELSRKSIERIEERKRVRQANPLCIPPEYAYSAKQEDKFEHNHSRGGIRSEDDDYTTPEDVDAIQKDLFLKHYGLTMADDRRKRKGTHNGL